MHLCIYLLFTWWIRQYGIHTYIFVVAIILEANSYRWWSWELKWNRSARHSRACARSLARSRLTYTLLLRYLIKRAVAVQPLFLRDHSHNSITLREKQLHYRPKTFFSTTVDKILFLPFNTLRFIEDILLGSSSFFIGRYNFYSVCKQSWVLIFSKITLMWKNSLKN